MGNKVHILKSQMNAGLLSPIVEGRSGDFETVKNACRQLQNGIVTIYGSVLGRGGTSYLTVSKNNEISVQIPFIVSESIAYVLEIGNKYIRVFKKYQPITVEGMPYEIETPYLISDLIDSKGRLLLDFKQSADVMYLVHEKYPMAKLSRTSETSWEYSVIDISDGPWELSNSDENKRITASDTTGIISLTAKTGTNPVAVIDKVGTGSSIALYGVLISFYVGGINGAGTEIGYQRWGFGSDVPQNSYAELAATLINSLSNYKAENPTRTSLKITCIGNQSEASEKDMSIFVKVFNILGDTTWKYNNSTFTKNEAAVNLFSEEWVGRKIRMHQIDTVVQGWLAGEEEVQINDLRKAGENYYIATSGGTAGGQMPKHTEGIESDGGVTWKYLHSGYGTVKVTKYISETQVTAKVISSILPEGVKDVGTFTWDLCSFDYSVSGSYPNCVEIFKDRVCYGLNGYKGPKVFMSVSGDYDNFADMEFGEQLTESALDIPISTELNKINWLCAQKYLIIGTEGSIIAIRQINLDNPLGPNNVTYDELANSGTCRIKPLKIGSDLLYIGPKGTNINTIQYNFENDAYEPKELSVLAKEILEPGICSWCSQIEPYKTIWAVKTDGTMVGLTYNKQHEVIAFHKHITNGKYTGVCVIPDNTNNIDRVWVWTERTIDGSTKRYIEYLRLDLPENITVSKEDDIDVYLQYLIDYSVHLDCAIEIHNSTPSSTVTGLEHLKNKEVTVVADGIDKTYTVSSTGTITLDSAATNIIVGLPYTVILEPQPINVDLDTGTGQGRGQTIATIMARVLNTHSFKYGEDINNLYVAKINTIHDNIKKDTLLSGDIVLNWPGNTSQSNLNINGIINTTGARCIFVQDRPFPVHWLAFILTMEVSDD